METNNMIITFDGREFNGLKLIKNKSKWASKEEAEKFFESLFDDGTEYSKLRYKNELIDKSTDAIHVNISHAIISEILMYTTIVLSIIFSYYSLLIMSIGFFGMSIGSFILRRYFYNEAKEIKVAHEMNLELLEYFFDNPDL